MESLKSPNYIITKNRMFLHTYMLIASTHKFSYDAVRQFIMLIASAYKLHYNAAQQFCEKGLPSQAAPIWKLNYFAAKAASRAALVSSEIFWSKARTLS